MAMNAQDWQDKSSERAQRVNELVEFCVSRELSYQYNEKKFTIALPHHDPISVIPPDMKKRKIFDIGKWGDKGVDEAELPSTDPNDPTTPDELPPTTTPLDEGKPPKGDEEK